MHKRYAVNYSLKFNLVVFFLTSSPIVFKNTISAVQFLSTVAERQVPMTSEAEVLLKKYFVASRRVRNVLGVAAKGTQFPQTAMTVL